MYCSAEDSDCITQAEQMRNGIPPARELAWEPLLQNYSVDMFVAAHLHNYERLLPVHNNGSSCSKWLATPSVITDADAPIHVSASLKSCLEFDMLIAWELLLINYAWC